MTKVYLTQCGSFTATHGHGGTLAEGPHAHTFTYQVTFYGSLNKEGYLIDFRAVQDFLAREITPRLDGANLNKLFENPTTEALAVWLFNALKPRFVQLYSVKVAEEPDRWIEYKGED